MKLRLRTRIFFATISVALFFCLVELFLYIVGSPPHADDTRFVLNPEWDCPEFYLKDHDLFWRLRPNRIITSRFIVEGEYRINRYGLRGPDFSPEQAPGAYRIICMGNSCTFGWRVAELQTYPRQLEVLLEESGANPPCEVINAGVTGYTSLQGLRFLKSDVLSWEPDLLIVSYGWNDQWAGAQDIADKDQKLPPQWVLDIQNLLARTRTYRAMKSVIFWAKKPPPADFSRTNPVYRVGLKDFRHNLAEIIRLAGEREITVILLTAPIAQRSAPEFAGVYEYHEKYNEIIRSFTSTPGVIVLDAAGEFARQTGFFDYPDADLKHYNPKGHKLIAAMLADTVKTLIRGN